ncbi:DUF4124 domain-containing protein [Acidovorax sp.]|uniref:DUF4124 domain-containing protein n=1 Tax=Acidovorax sp. TaxID=1872122 RepID=UPI002ACDBD1F|nr:DUF4124 domain-containing protein [Acidovorax sp.]MDZ7865381.1 DUF4124 domain-containing protein [Acidovorax sp.]
MRHSSAKDCSMNPIRCAACSLLLAFVAPAWAINKCTDANGKVSFQDAPCVGQGEKIDVRPAMQGATPIPPSPSAAQEGAFGPSWQRKNFLQSQGIPQARAAVERNQRECAAAPQQQEGVAQSGAATAQSGGRLSVCEGARGRCRQGQSRLRSAYAGTARAVEIAGRRAVQFVTQRPGHACALRSGAGFYPFQVNGNLNCLMNPLGT